LCAQRALVVRLCYVEGIPISCIHAIMVHSCVYTFLGAWQPHGRAPSPMHTEGMRGQRGLMQSADSIGTFVYPVLVGHVLTHGISCGLALDLLYSSSVTVDPPSCWVVEAFPSQAADCQSYVRRASLSHSCFVVESPGLQK
jgi:hypothetical protein